MRQQGPRAAPPSGDQPTAASACIPSGATSTPNEGFPRGGMHGIYVYTLLIGRVHARGLAQPPRLAPCGA